MPTRLERIADLEQRLADLEARNRKRKSQLRAKKGRLEAAERTRERKLRTRRLILLGSIVEQDLDLPNSALLQRLDRALERKQDRALFQQLSRPAASEAPLPGWTPAKLHGGAWGARFQGDTSQLPANLKGLTISVTASSGKSWIATVTEIVGRSSDLVVVGTQKLDQ